MNISTFSDIVSHYVDYFHQADKRLGANYVPGQGTYMRLWAPYAETVDVQWENGQNVALTRDDGYFTGVFPDAKPGDQYWFILNGKTRLPDPASRFQPLGFDGPSEIVVDDFAWTDQNWKGGPYDETVIYEIHTGTYSTSHDFDGIIADLPRLKEMGITMLEIMPVSQFPGKRNWGYDGTFPHAVQNSYGGPQKLKALVDACHAQGLAIILDVVYNHLGPEGNALFQCGPYNTPKYRTNWGDGINFDDEGSNHVRRYFLQSAWQWLTEFHFDGLRLDAIQMIYDSSARPFLQELTVLKQMAEEQRGFPLVMIGETDKNDCRVVMPFEQNGFGLTAQWGDDFHHCLHASLTGEQKGYYTDYGGVGQMARIYLRGVAFEGEYSPFHKRHHGRSYEGIDKKAIIAESQNHDQVGNRPKGDRITAITDFSKAKLSAACVLLSPFTPLLFMGEDMATDKPFSYFIDAQDEELREAIKKGRAEEWKSFDVEGELLDPTTEEAFQACILDVPSHINEPRTQTMMAYYKELIALSKKLRKCVLKDAKADGALNYVMLDYAGPEGRYRVYLSFSNEAIDYPDRSGDIILESAEFQYDQPIPDGAMLPPWSATVFKS